MYSVLKWSVKFGCVFEMISVLKMKGVKICLLRAAGQGPTRSKLRGAAYTDTELAQLSH